MMKHNKVQYVSVLGTANNYPPFWQPNDPPPLVIVDGKEEYYVEKVLDVRILRQRLYYRVKFVVDNQPE